MKTILGMIRDPQTSDGFIQYLFELAKDLNVQVHLLYVENPAQYPLGVQDTTGAALANLQKSLEKKVDEGKKILNQHLQEMMPTIAGKVIVEVSTRIGNEAMLIDEMVNKGQAHMLAVEYRHMSGFWQKDSFVKEMMRSVRCPVWVVPEDTEYKGLHHIVYATDYHEEDIRTLQRLIDLTGSFSPEIEALHITDSIDFDEKVKKEGFQKMLVKKTGYAQISLTSLHEHNGHDMTKLINSYANRTKTDLIVVLKENKNFLERIFTPSSSEKIVSETKRPILVFHEE
jgi:nucleotide-binding universal stress UspA family protein